MCLIGFSLIDPVAWLNVLKVAVALGLVIFVHELGHFVVAKLCGVKCEKFYLGFDIFGLKLFKFRWGETEYGIGALPLGGYVKMLGQEDNPAAARAEMERAKLAQGEGGGAATTGGDETPVYDPRSYLAQSVPKRMAIISAGVVMNVIFAFVFATMAYMIGVEEEPSIVGSMAPGMPGWRAGLQPGDRVTQVGDTPSRRFRDLTKNIILGDNLDEGIDFVIERRKADGSGYEQLPPLRIIPDRDSKKMLVPKVGIGPLLSASLTKAIEREPQFKGIPVLPAALDEMGQVELQPGDKITAIDGQAVKDGVDIDRIFASNPGPVTLTVAREESQSDGKETKTVKVDVRLPARKMKVLGFTNEMGPVKFVQANSPAAAAGIQPGDVLVAIDGQPIEDPLRVPDQLRDLAGKNAKLTFRRDKSTVDFDVPLRAPLDIELPAQPGAPLSAPALGIAFEVSNRVRDVAAGGPAARAGLKPGVEINSVTFLPPTKEYKWYEYFDQDPKPQPVELSREKPNWPGVSLLALQDTPPGTKVELGLSDGTTVPLEPELSSTWFNPDRGLALEPEHVMVKADSLGEAMRLGTDEAVDSVLQVYRFLGKIGHQVSAKAAGGPITIAQQAFHTANQGFSQLLIFLAMLSANLAVINFLPIPLLDGGHMVFLIYEGIRGKPASERLIVAFHYAGLLFILSLMAFVFMLDLGIISRFNN